ncbi:hypothetical protein EDC04DRAFT_2867510 [Pisolithus marmoratus]|nr:hypothetical protein EDC04DRAFT_2867510 [Pisolithus marmoratus]
MYSNAPNQWSQNITEQAAIVDPSLSSNNDWKDRTTTTASSNGSPTAQPGLDLSDFGLGDIPGPSTSNSISPPPQSYFPQAFPPFYPPVPVPGPYNAVPYTAMSWSTQPTPLPLTTFSTLNGATSASLSASQASTSQQQPSPPANSTQSQMMIDPVLTTMSGSESAQRYTQTSSHENVQRTQPQSQQQQTQYSYQQPTLSINPAYVLPSHFYSPQHQQSQVQTTLAPHVLHSPSTPQTGIQPSVSAVASSSTVNSETRRTKLSTDVRPLLQPTSFTGAGAVNSLVGLLDDYGSQDVDAELRFEILTKIRDNAGNHYFRAWLENPTAMDITREWLKAGLLDKSVKTIMPLLHIVDRLPMTVDALKASKLGKIIVKLVKDPPAPAVKDMASNLERKWRQLVEAATKQGSENNSTEDTKVKKRKPTEPPAAKAQPPTKKATFSSTPAPVAKATVVKRETKPGVPAIKDSRSDSSFFSAPKPKPKLPSFKKAPVPVKKEPDLNIAQPSSIDPFQEALKSMGKARKESPAAPTPPSAASTPTANFVAGVTGKIKRKSVTWAPDGQLESIRLIERAVYDDDPVDGVHTAHSLRDLDRGEGAALHAHLFEELIDWMDPIPIDIPIDIEVVQRGQLSLEKSVQEEREQTALGALYMNVSQIPESPGEPSTTIAEEEVDAGVKLMTVGPESDNIFWSEVPSSQQVSVADLVRQLASGAVDQVMGLHPPNGSATAMPLSFDPSILTTIPPEQMQQLLQQAQVLFGDPGQGQPNAQPPNFVGMDQSWDVSAANSNTYGSDFGQQEYSDDTNHTNRGKWSSDRGRGRSRGGGGRGGRGRGGDDGSYRSSKRKPCSFFAEGRCKYGDQCDFSHEPIY